VSTTQNLALYCKSLNFLTPLDHPHHIVRFVSTVCNNDVCYSYAIDTKGRYYFLFDFDYLETIPEDSTDLPSKIFQYYFSNQRQAKKCTATVVHDRVW
jgi:hypothetical protein